MGIKLLLVVEIPGAGDWPRIQAWLSCRRVRMIGENEEYVRFDDFAATWDSDHPETVPVLPEPASSVPQAAPSSGADPETAVAADDPVVVVEEIGGPSLERAIVDLQLGPDVVPA